MGPHDSSDWFVWHLRHFMRNWVRWLWESLHLVHCTNYLSLKTVLSLYWLSGPGWRESAILWQLWLIFDGINVGRRIWANQLPYLLTVIDVKKLVQIFNFDSSAQFVSEQQLEMGGYQPSGTSCQIGGSKTKIKHLGEVGRVTFCAKKT